MHRIGRLEDHDGVAIPDGILQENKNEETMKRISFMYHIQTPFWYPDIIVHLEIFFFHLNHEASADSSTTASIVGHGFLIASCNLTMHPLGPLTEPEQQTYVSIIHSLKPQRWMERDSYR